MDATFPFPFPLPVPGLVLGPLPPVPEPPTVGRGGVSDISMMSLVGLDIRLDRDGSVLTFGKDVEVEVEAEPLPGHCRSKWRLMLDSGISLEQIGHATSSTKSVEYCTAERSMSVLYLYLPAYRRQLADLTSKCKVYRQGEQSHFGQS